MGNDGERKSDKLQPPDGGWGWMIVCGSALSHMFLIPIMQNFTLVFKDRFAELGFSSTHITSLVSLNASFGLILGLLNGPLLKTFGYRKLALTGGTIYVIGLLCTGTAKSYIEFIIYYGMLSSLGMVTVMASFSLAINSYFLKNRSKAVGYLMTLIGLGPIVLPIAISFLLSSFGVKYTVFLLSGLSLHVYPGALLLQPVRKHMKRKEENFETPDQEVNVMMPDVNSYLEISVWGSKMSLRSHSAEPPLKSRRIYSGDILHENPKMARALREDIPRARRLSLTYLDNEDYKNMMNSTLHMIEGMEISGQTPNYASVETLSLDLEQNLHENLMEPLNPKPEVEPRRTLQRGAPALPDPVEPGLCLRFINFLKIIYDLDLLHDPLYINLIVGLSLAFVGEIVFSTMTPLILKEIGFDTEKTATFMSIIAGCDLICRFIAPFVGRSLNLNSREMYLVALFMLLISRTSMYMASTYEMYVLVSFGLGIGKGFRSVFWVLVLPDYVPISKLPSASAIQSLINGLLILISGPVIGAITNMTHKYSSIIVAANVLTAVTVFLWTGEIVIRKYKAKTQCQDSAPS